MRWCRLRGMSPNSTPTTQSRPITAGSRQDYDRCADSRPSPRRAPSRPDTRSCRTCVAATTPSPTTRRSVIESASHSTSSLCPCNCSAAMRRRHLRTAAMQHRRLHPRQHPRRLHPRTGRRPRRSQRHLRAAPPTTTTRGPRRASRPRRQPPRHETNPRPALTRNPSQRAALKIAAGK